MKTAAFVSLACNVLLAGLAGFLWIRPQASVPAPAPRPVAEVAPPQKIAAPARPAPFHWNQVESEDYPTYIANLRRIGCPEETIRRLVTSEINQIYQEKQQKFETSHQRPMQPSELRQMRQEQATMLAQTFPATPSTAAATPSAGGGAAASPASRLRTAESTPVYPLVFAAVGPSGVSPSASPILSPAGGALPALPAETAAAALNQIRQDFVDQIGGTNQNPSDPLYLQRWSQAQRLADERMRSMMGAEYFNRYSIEAARKAYEAQALQR